MQKVIQSLLFTIVCLISFCSYGQPKYGIIRFHAFVQESAGGNIPVDEQGNPMHSGVHTNYVVFVETTGKMIPRFDSVFTKDKVFAVQAVEIKEGRKNIGKLKDATTNTAIKTVKRANRLWQLALTETENAVPKKIQKLLTKNQMIVSGKYKTTKFSYPIAKLKQLETIFLQ